MSDLISKDKQHVWHPFTQHQTSGDPLGIVRAEGSLLFDADNKSYLDANSSWWVNTHGHGHPHIGKAISDQFKALDHVVFAGVTHPKAVELAERLCKRLPDAFEKVFFSDNGSTAIEVALKMSFQFWHNQGTPKRRVLAMSGAYHGDTFGAMSVGQRDYFNRPFESFFFDADYLDFPTETNHQAILDHAEKLFNTGEFAAFIVEPLIQGASGMRMYEAAFLDRLVSLAKRYDVLVIFDEVMTGFGRTGQLFAMDHCAQKPDIIAFSKGLTAGVLPMGLTVTSTKMFETFLDDSMARGFLHGHSFTGNPMACAAACASLDLFDRPETWKQIEAISEWSTAFASTLKEIDRVIDVQVLGTIVRFEISDLEERTYFATEIRAKAYAFFLANGILIRPLGNVLFVNPPYCFTQAEYAKVSGAIIDFLKTI